jgi:hypothetical protein
MYNNVRKEFTERTAYVSELSKKYISNFKSELASWTNSEYSSIWERLLQHDGKKLNPQMLFKNPYDDTNDLTELDRNFLKAYLWEINKYRLNLSDLEIQWTYEKDKDKIEALDIVKTNI